MVRLVNRAKMTTATTGTGTITLGTASGGFQTFTDAGVVDGDLVRYVIEEGTAFELGSGVFSSAGGTLTRNPSESSAGGGAITLTGNAQVFLTAASTDIQQPPGEGPFVDGDKTKLDGIAAGAQVNVATNLSITNGTTAGPSINSSTGTNVTFPTASGTISGAVTTGTQTFAGTKTFSGAVILGQAGTATNRAVRADRNIATGTGILGGGNLTANRTFSIHIPSVAEARAGSINTKVMTPLRVRQSVGAATAGLAFGAVGTYAFLVSNATDTRFLNPGSTVLGSSVRFGGVNRFAGFAVTANNVSVENGNETGLNRNNAVGVAGTWRMMGNPRAFDANRGFGTIALRIA